MTMSRRCAISGRWCGPRRTSTAFARRSRRTPASLLFTLVNPATRAALEMRCRALGLPTVAPLDPVNDALSALLGQVAKARPGRQHVLDAAYFARVDAIQFTIAHDDGIAWEEWEEADIVLAGVSRWSKTPTSIYLANRGFKTANIPIVVEDSAARPALPAAPSTRRRPHDQRRPARSRCGAIACCRSTRRPRPTTSTKRR
ncbi:kinase/pyrophosphorylase [Sphingomonas sp. MMS24-JH45]